MLAFRSLSDDRDAERWIPQVLPWLQEAGEPYYRWFFGGLGSGTPTASLVAGWMRRRSSEISIQRAVLLVAGDRAIGGFIALGGEDLGACRRADTLAALAAAGRDGRGALRERIRTGQRLFAPVEAEALYLSKLWVAAGSRGMGHGGRLLREYLDTGLARGFRRFQLDVGAENRPAVALYRSAGFEVVGEAPSQPAGMTYLSMALELGRE